MSTTEKIYESQALPSGFEWGAFWSHQPTSQSGYYIIRTFDEAAVKAETTPDGDFNLTKDEFLEWFEENCTGCDPIKRGLGWAAR